MQAPIILPVSSWCKYILLSFMWFNSCSFFQQIEQIQQNFARAMLVPIRMASASLQALICLICFIALIIKVNWLPMIFYISYWSIIYALINSPLLLISKVSWRRARAHRVASIRAYRRDHVRAWSPSRAAIYNHKIKETATQKQTFTRLFYVYYRVLTSGFWGCNFASEIRR